MSDLPKSKNTNEIRPVCNRPGCQRSPFDWLQSFKMGLGSGFDNRFRPVFAEMTRELNNMQRATKMSENGFEAYVDVQHFLPNEITVTTENNSIIVHAKHEEKNDEHGFVSREFTRRYDLPQGINGEDIASNISSDGVLSIRAPPAGSVHHIPIERDESTPSTEK